MDYKSGELWGKVLSKGMLRDIAPLVLACITEVDHLPFSQHDPENVTLTFAHFCLDVNQLLPAPSTPFLYGSV